MLLPLFPLRVVLFPGMLLPLHIFEARYREMVGRCLAEKQPFGVLLIRAGQEVGAPAVTYDIGASARITRSERLADGRLNIEALGHERFRVLAYQHDQAYPTAQVEPFPLAGGDQPAAQQAAGQLRPWLSQYLTTLGQSQHSQRLPPDPSALAYLAAIVAQIPAEEKQRLLATPVASDLLCAERRLYRREVALARCLAAVDGRPATPYHPN